jgi:hypothetical protein
VPKLYDNTPQATDLRAPFTNSLPFPFPSIPLLLPFPKKHQIQNILFFFTFYITSIIFYYYLNKKIHYNTNFFPLFHRNYFYFISHQSLSIFTQQKNSHKGKGRRLLNGAQINVQVKRELKAVYT